MDFTKQCKRFLNYRTINAEQLKKRFTNISALGCIKTANKHSVFSYKIVIHDNDEQCTYVVNESDGKLLAQTDKNLQFQSFGICCSYNPNFVYVSDFTNNRIRKFDENLKEIGELKIDTKLTKNFSGPCQITINEYLKQIHIIDQNNCRVVIFDLKTNEFISEFNLFEEDLNVLTKPEERNLRMDLTAKLKGHDHVENKVVRAKIEFKAFGIYTKNERLYVTDWNRGLLFIYKNGRDEVWRLERKVVGEFSRPRDILLDNLDSMLVADLDNDHIYCLDNKGTFLFKTAVPRKSTPGSFLEEKGVFGLAKLDNKIVFASNSTIYICELNQIIEN